MKNNRRTLLEEIRLLSGANEFLFRLAVVCLNAAPLRFLRGAVQQRLLLVEQPLHLAALLHALDLLERLAQLVHLLLAMLAHKSVRLAEQLIIQSPRGLVEAGVQGALQRVSAHGQHKGDRRTGRRGSTTLRVTDTRCFDDCTAGLLWLRREASSSLPLALAAIWALSLPYALMPILLRRACSCSKGTSARPTKR